MMKTTQQAEKDNNSQPERFGTFVEASEDFRNEVLKLRDAIVKGLSNVFAPFFRKKKVEKFLQLSDERLGKIYAAYHRAFANALITQDEVVRWMKALRKNRSAKHVK